MSETQRSQETLKRKESELDEIQAKRFKGEVMNSASVIPQPVSLVDPNGSEFWRLLANTKVEALWSKECKIFYSLRTDKVKDVFKGMIAHNFTSCPVLQKTKNKWYGFMDLADIIKFIVIKFPEQSTLESQEDIHSLLESSEEFRNCQVKDISKSPLAIQTNYHPMTQGYSLFSAFELMARERSLHRIPIVDKDRHLVSVLTQSQLVDFAWKNLSSLGSVVRSKLVGEMGYNLHEVLSVKTSDIALSAFSLMVEKNVTGVAVLDDKGYLIDQISLHDLKAITSEGHMFGRLYKSVQEFLTHVRKESQFQRPNGVICCTKSNTLEQVMSMVQNNSIHRVFVVESEQDMTPIGIISLRDILLELIPGGHC